MKPFKLIGELPEGDWQFCLIDINGAPAVIVIVDRSGNNAPRMVIGDKLQEIAP